MSSAPPCPRPLHRFGAAARLATSLLLVAVALMAWASTASARTGPILGASSTAPEEAAAARDELGPVRATVLGLVEGVTEFLPVSSTGHLAVVERLLGMDSEATKEARDAYAVVIQAGAILAVLVLYWRRLLNAARGAISLPGRLRARDGAGLDEGQRVFVALVIGVTPALVAGFLLEKTIKAHLFGPGPIVAAWIVGGVALLALSRSGWWERGTRGADLVDIGVRNAAIIGVAQCLALWPGTSRSLVTIVTALLLGLSLAAAVEYSFLLGFLTLGAATAYDTLKHGSDIADSYGYFSPLLGFVVAFVAAVAAVRWMVSYLQNHDLAIFGYYRLGIAAVTIGLLATGTI